MITFVPPPPLSDLQPGKIMEGLFGALEAKAKFLDEKKKAGKVHRCFFTKFETNFCANILRPLLH